MSARRFTRGIPCPICGGFDSAPRGKGIRCSGFLSSDGAYAHCSRAECGRQENGGTWAHRLDGPCACGKTHGIAVAARRFPAMVLEGGRSSLDKAARDAAPLWRRLALRDPAGEAYLAGRFLLDESLIRADLLRFNVGTSFDWWIDMRAREGYRVAFPVRRSDGSIANVSLRRVEQSGGAFGKKLVLPGCTTSGVAICRPEITQLALGDPEFERDEIELCEGGPDFLALTLAGVVSLEEGSTPPRWALGTVGASNAPGVVEAFASVIRGRTLRIALDPDDAGETAAKDAARAAYRVGARQVIRVRPRSAKDFADLWAGVRA